MGRIRNSARFLIRWIPWVATGAAAAYSRLPDNSQHDIKEVAKEPSVWGESIEKAWDSSKITADHFRNTSAILAKIFVGRSVRRKPRSDFPLSLICTARFCIATSRFPLASSTWPVAARLVRLGAYGANWSPSTTRSSSVRSRTARR